MCSTDYFPVIVKMFSGLKDLYLADICMDTIPTYTVHHRLKKLHLQGVGDSSLTPFVFWTLEMCENIIEELHLTCSGGKLEDSFLSTIRMPSPLAGANLRSLRLDGDSCNFLARPDSNLAFVIRQLPSLQHLHMSGRLQFHPNAFCALPPSLRCLHISDYETWVNYQCLSHKFIAALSTCLDEAADTIERVVVLSATREDFEDLILDDLSSLHCICSDRNIPLCFEIHRDTFTPPGDIRILCKSVQYYLARHLNISLQLLDSV